MAYAVEMKLLERNPITDLKWTASKTLFQVDRRSVVNPSQALALLEAVGAQKRSGPLLLPFFAALYFAGLRPGAGNSVAALLRTYAKRLVGQDEISKRRISEVLRRETWARIRHDQPPRADDSRTQPDTDT